MPIAKFFCEGKTDARLIRAICAGLPINIEPFQGKYGLGDRVKVNREETKIVVAAIRDRDFDDDSSEPLNSLREWIVLENGNAISLGWYWERKELENYLIDPNVVANVLGEDTPSDYVDALNSAVLSISEYSSARTALTCCRPQFSPLSSSWGRERGKDKHKFPDERTENDCRLKLEDLITTYNEAQQISSVSILENYERFLVECRPDGIRHAHFLTFFSGKDLLFAMEGALLLWGFQTPNAFRETILQRIQDSSEDVWRWLPEWEDLRNAVIQYE